MRDFDWIVIGSGFGGSVSALRLAEKGYRVALIERGQRYTDATLPRSGWEFNKTTWAPERGLKGIMRLVVHRHIATSAQTGLGGGSIVYGGVLYRAKPQFYTDPQWGSLRDWEQELAPHYAEAERMLGVSRVPFDSPKQKLMRDMAEHFGVADTFTRAPCGVFFGEPGKTVPDPYFGGAGPDRTGCTRCGSCMVGCTVGAANTLGKNYLWFAEKLGVTIMTDREAVDLTPIGAADGSDGYRVLLRQPGKEKNRVETLLTATGVVVAGGALATNELLANCKHGGSLPRLSDSLGTQVRTNSEAILNVLLPEDRQAWHDVAASSSIHLDHDTHLEFLTHGTRGDITSLIHTVLVGDGTRLTRPLKWLARIIRHPGQWLRTLRIKGWSRRMIMLLVMQTLDNSIALKPHKLRSGKGYRLVSYQSADKPIPLHIPIANTAAEWLARHTGGVAQSSIFEVWKNIPTTAHLLGGAVIGADPASGVIDRDLRVFGYTNMIVCDGAAMPANPGVNPALTITALAEYAMSRVPAKP
jgi:cholesterol oxidase